MVKNRNWENRVELAEARRVAAKQRKQRRDDKQMYKTMVQELLEVMDSYSQALVQNKTIQVWTDTLPSDSPPLLDMYGEEQEAKFKRRSRSSSFHEPCTPNNRKGRTRRANSFNERGSTGSGKKKSRSRSNSNAGEVDETTAAPKLCLDHFFKGKCGESQQRKSGCRHVHYKFEKYETLASVLNNDAASKQTLKMSQKAARACMLESMTEAEAADNGGMDMVYYFSIDLRPNDNGGNKEETRKVSDIVSKALSDKSCSLASIVYVTVNNYLVFDRSRDGLVMSEGAFCAKVLGQLGRSSRSMSMESYGEDSVDMDHHHHPLVLLPGPLLEHILTFLPDVSVPTMCAVCQAWREEIGTTSPALWKHLLKRRKWPLPDESSNSNARDLYRNDFLMHYAVMRNVQAIQTGTSGLISRKAVEEKEMTLQAFSTRRGAPQMPNGCTQVKIWSPKRVLAAYSHDCTLRLFEAVEKSSTSDGKMLCREVVCVRAAPFANTKKGSYHLMAMDLDEDMVGCLCTLVTNNKDSFFLTVTSREDFLCSGGHGSSLDTVHVIDIGEAVLNYMLSCDVMDHALLRLSDFLMDNDMSNVEVLVSQSIVACGHGRFMVEVAISIPTRDADHFDDDDFDQDMVLLDRKLVLFSAAAAAIVWMGESNPTQSFQPRYEDLNLVCMRDVGSRNTTCSLAVVSSTCPVILTGEIEPTGHVHFAQPLQASGWVRSEILAENWEISNVCQRPVVIMSSDVIVADNLTKEAAVDVFDRKAVISFYPRTAVDGNDSYSILNLEGMCEAIRMESIGDHHVVILCRVYSNIESREGDDDIDDDNDDSEEEEAVYAIVVHVPTRQEIQRTLLLENPADCFARCYSYDIPIFLAASGDTVGVGVWWKGMILTGNDVRSVGEQCKQPQQAESSSAKKKKKKRQPNRGSKKDAYTRGMSLFG